MRAVYSTHQPESMACVFSVSTASPSTDPLPVPTTTGILRNRSTRGCKALRSTSSVFPLGTHAALEVSAVIPGQVRSLHLISAAAPLDGGAFLDEMAGKAVFSLAKRNPYLFQWLVKWQALLAKRAPQMLFRMLFASAQGQDREQVKSPEFKALICQVLQQCFAQGTSGYTRDIQQYLQPWSAGVFAIKADVCLWHGTQDNWSPFGMSTSLAECLPSTAGVEPMEGLSHYSCLYAAAPRICALLASA
ncbi:hypothetical protein [Ectopseudomonas mendocina]|uniref:hypothetical protein n=1 Tax=Ectopseudomonas mendocina TaxID=300 RepID=UPI003F091863